MSDTNANSVLKLRDLERELERTEKTLTELVRMLARTAEAVDFHTSYLVALRAEIQHCKEVREIAVPGQITFMEIQTA